MRAIISKVLTGSMIVGAALAVSSSAYNKSVDPNAEANKLLLQVLNAQNSDGTWDLYLLSKALEKTDAYIKTTSLDDEVHTFLKNFLNAFRENSDNTSVENRLHSVSSGTRVFLGVPIITKPDSKPGTINFVMQRPHYSL